MSNVKDYLTKAVIGAGILYGMYFINKCAENRTVNRTTDESTEENPTEEEDHKDSTILDYIVEEDYYGRL
jgi:hypothetical protein